MFRSFTFVLRIAFAWTLAILAVLFVLAVSVADNHAMAFFMLIGLAIVIFAVIGAVSYLTHAQLVDGRIDDALNNRQRRRIEIPYAAADAFDLVDAVLRELPHVEDIERMPASLRIRVRVRRPDVYGPGRLARLNPVKWFSRMHNRILATITPGDGASAATLVCEPEASAWTDWFLIDGGTNLENARTVTLALTQRIAERRRDEQRAADRTAADKELSEARLNLLQAQIEPHFLYNTLANAQLLTRSEPQQADRMLGHLIRYLRHSLPRIGDTDSTLGEELERVRAYLEILRVRMGDRLTLKIEVPEDLHAVAFPAMMLQPLVENAIKHGLEPKSGGGTIWILARRDTDRDEDRVAITVADDGRGFGEGSGGTGIGLKNVRERLRLRFDGRASLSIVANVPEGVSATLTLPIERTAPVDTPEPAAATSPETDHD